MNSESPEFLHPRPGAISRREALRGGALSAAAMTTAATFSKQVFLKHIIYNLAASDLLVQVRQTASKPYQYSKLGLLE